MAFFSAVATILLVLDAAFFFPMVWIPWLQTGIVEHFPTLIVCGFVSLAIILAVFAGMILDSIRQKERREFEFRLIVLKEIRENRREQ